MFLTPSRKAMLRRFGWMFGLDVHLNSPRNRDDLRLIHFINFHRIDVVLDVGANVGQFAKNLFDLGYMGRVVSFEPMPEAYARLEQAASKYPDRWIVGPRIALSDLKGNFPFYITSASTSSSLLHPSEEFSRMFAGAAVADRIQVPTDRLDALIDDLISPGERVLIKIDVQGAELRVLNGATAALKLATGLLVETNFMKMYDTQPSATSLGELITSEGFEFWDLAPVYRDPGNLRLAQIDLLYFKALQA